MNDRHHQSNPYHPQRHCRQPLRPVWPGMADNETFPQIGRFKHQKVTPLLAPNFWSLFSPDLAGAASDDQILYRLTVL